MADEAVILEITGTVPGNPINFGCANDTGIEKGTLLQLVDEKTVSGSIGDLPGAALHLKFAGIAAEEKVANDGAVRIGVFTQGIFDLVAEGAITLGEFCEMSGNHITPIRATDAGISGAIVGKVLGTASDGEVVSVAVGTY